jgi:hypothetical protein
VFVDKSSLKEKDILTGKEKCVDVKTDIRKKLDILEKLLLKQPRHYIRPFYQ